MTLRNSARSISPTIVQADCHFGYLPQSCIRLHQLSMENIDKKQAQLKVYPNPGSGIFTMEFENKQTVKQIKVYNSLGQIVKSFQSTQGVKSYKIDLSGQAKGLYFIGIESGNNVLFTKIILE